MAKDTSQPQASSKKVAKKTAETAVDDSIELQDNEQSQSVVHPLSFADDESPATKINTKQMPRSKKASPVRFVIAGLIAILLGVGTGYGSFKLYAQNQGIPTDGSIEKVASGDIQVGDVFGSTDTETFDNSAKGYLEAGGIDGEGTHSLLRPGGPAQTVYLTSSITDLDKLVGMEVELWGETFKGQKAGWLMDVGRVQVIKVDGEKPAE